MSYQAQIQRTRARALRLLRDPLCVDLTHCRTAGSSKPACRITICMWASQLLSFVCFILSRSIVSRRAGAATASRPSRHQLSTLHGTNARALLPIATLQLLQLVICPFRTPRTSYEIGRPAITLRGLIEDNCYLTSSCPLVR